MKIGTIESMDNRLKVDLLKLVAHADSIMSTIMDDVTVEPESGETVSPWDATKTVADIQENIACW